MGDVGWKKVRQPPGRASFFFFFIMHHISRARAGPVIRLPSPSRRSAPTLTLTQRTDWLPLCQSGRAVLGVGAGVAAAMPGIDPLPLPLWEPANPDRELRKLESAIRDYGPFTRLAQVQRTSTRLPQPPRWGYPLSNFEPIQLVHALTVYRQTVCRDITRCYY
jgi:hypothetical protein